MDGLRSTLALLCELGLVVLVVAAAIVGGWRSGLIALVIAMTIWRIPSWLLRNGTSDDSTNMRRPH